MAGGLMQLVAYGAQDVYLTGNPQITFWKVTYRRHTNFSIESIEQTFNGQADFGRRVQCVISRNGDLAYRTYLQVTLPEINQQMGNQYGANTNQVYARWLDFPGEQIIAQVEVEIGGQRIDRQYGDWMHIWNQLTLTSEQQRGYYKMIGNTTQLTFITDPSFSDVEGPCNSLAPRQVCAPRRALPETTLYVPLQFWFCTNPGLALPLIALQYHEVKINLDIRPIDECLWAVTSLSCNSGAAAASTQFPQGTSVAATIAYNQSLVAASLYVDYVFLDTDERRRMAQNPHEYLITQLQFTGDESVGSSSNKIKLNFNHPVKELIWVVQPDANVDYCSSLVCDTILFKVLGAQPFNYTDAVDALPNAIHAFGGPNAVAQSGYNGVDNAFINANGLFQDAGALDGYFTGLTGYWNGPSEPYNEPGFGGPAVPYVPGNGTGYITDTGSHNLTSSVSDAGTFVLTETSLDMHCWGLNPVVTAKLQLNGQDRFTEREGTYFSLVQPYQHHTRNPDEGINVYSFALRPEEHQPSGTCNFSRIDNATLQLVLSNATVQGTNTAKVRVYATNFNVLRVMSGIQSTCAKQLDAIIAICCLLWVNIVKQIYKSYNFVSYNQLVSKSVFSL